MRSAATPEPTRPLGRGAALMFAIACGVAVGNVYLPQPLLGPIAADLHITSVAADLVATLAQLGYAVGILLLVPLGDVARPRRLITTLLYATAASLTVAAVAPSLAVLAAAATLAGAFTVVPQILVPLASRLAAPEQAGRVVGQLIFGLFAGIFGSRILGSLLAQATNWRIVYATAALLAVIIASLLRPVLPNRPSGSPDSYLRLLAGLPGLLRRQAVLRHACMFQFCAFAAFSATWTLLAVYLTGPHFGWSVGSAGLFGLVGLAAGLFTPAAGRWMDRRGPEIVIGAALVALAVAVAVLALAGATVAGLVVGMLLLTAGMQISQIANQTRIFAERPDARSRVNTVYMVAVFLGGSLGSAAGAAVYDSHGWAGICGLDAVLIVLALAAFLQPRKVLHRPGE